MIFSELYGAYYNAVANILKEATKHPVSKPEMRRIIEEQAFSESVLAIEPALFSGRWPLLRPDGTAILKHAPERPLTLLEKRWLKAILLDPRIRLFDCEITQLSDVAPLFMPEDIYIFDQYADGDPYTDETYIAHFRLILCALKERHPLAVDVENRRGTRTHMNVMPEYLEYSGKDDKFRLITSGCHYGRVINLAKILSVKRCKMEGKMAEWARNPAFKETAASLDPHTKSDKKISLVFELYDGRNALERALLHFAHFEKEAERVDEKHYRVRVNYEKDDETEMVIRVLSFGPFLRVVEPESFVELIKKRLLAQRGLEREEGE